MGIADVAMGIFTISLGITLFIINKESKLWNIFKSEDKDITLYGYLMIVCGLVGIVMDVTL